MWKMLKVPVGLRHSSLKDQEGEDDAEIIDEAILSADDDDYVFAEM